ncbi:Hypothetical protein I595_1252 [Croceitalea dokdonensis DOKDO 023]|uniref:Uncharacterized protein n=1 Tax=Croceitalea dokdonensis DOKDO 023 TaxID=1300341 RepID=A0A0P7AXD2_9FLAO|nr:Hypothetical protein I595_1252 [Croceitalea dokdonensis DOKDO 023]
MVGPRIKKDIKNSFTYCSTTLLSDFMTGFYQKNTTFAQI